MSDLPGSGAITPVPPGAVNFVAGLWHERQATVRQITLPSQLEQNRKTGALQAYQWEWKPGEIPRPWRIWVGDIAKWVEAAAYWLAGNDDPELLATARQVIEDILAGQKDDGYLYSNPIVPENRFSNLLGGHELYDMGHLMEASVAWYEATCERKFLEAMERTADLLVKTFGPEPGQHPGYDGHQEIELALVRLFRATGQEEYLHLARHFIAQRGREPHYMTAELRARGEDPAHHWFDSAQPYINMQAHRPVRDQHEAVGHAVRAMYQACAVADLLLEENDAELREACLDVWRSVVDRRMYITGGIGSSAHGEAFTQDYDLPNETAYAKSCAAIGLCLFAYRLQQLELKGEYADVLERALYNGALGGLSLDGKHYFYANPLTISRVDDNRESHSGSRRSAWFGCACCPPNLARLITGLRRFFYSTSANTLYVHQYAASRTTFTALGIELEQITAYPWDGGITLRVHGDGDAPFTLALRLPDWCPAYTLQVNGRAVETRPENGYLHVERIWRHNDVVELALDMPPVFIRAHPAVRAAAGKVAVQRGPLIYCFEEVDNGSQLHNLVVDTTAAPRQNGDLGLYGGMVSLQFSGYREVLSENALYANGLPSPRTPVELTAVPFFLRCNRDPGEMMVWMRAYHGDQHEA